MGVVVSRLPSAEAVLVAYSGGKDSLAVLDVCVRAGKRVEAFFMYFLPGMDYTEYWCEYAERRFDVKVHRLQHFLTGYYLRAGVFGGDVPSCPATGHNDVEALARERSGIEWVGYGYKLSDSPSRRSMMTFMADWGAFYDIERRRVIYDRDGRCPKCEANPHPGIAPKLRRFAPVMDWADRDVYAYLSRHRVEIPPSHRRMSGVSLLPSSLATMREHWPADYNRIIRAFPGAAAQADRAELVKSQKAAWRQKLRAGRELETAQPGEDSGAAIPPDHTTMATGCPA